MCWLQGGFQDVLVCDCRITITILACLEGCLLCFAYWRIEDATIRMMVQPNYLNLSFANNYLSRMPRQVSFCVQQSTTKSVKNLYLVWRINFRTD